MSELYTYTYDGLVRAFLWDWTGFHPSETGENISLYVFTRNHDHNEPGQIAMGLAVVMPAVMELLPI